MDALVKYGTWGLLGVSAAVIVAAAITVLSPAVRRAGGLWHLDLLLILVGPIGVTLTGLGASDLSTFSATDTAAKFVKYAVIVLSIYGIVSRPLGSRLGGVSAGLVLTVMLFYVTLLASAAFGYVRSFPEAYWTTPLFVLACVIDGRFTVAWLLQRFRWMLRGILLITAASAVFIHSTAWLADSSRHLFGDSRLQGLTGHPNALAFITVAGFLLEVQAKSKWPWRAGFLAALALTQSSTAYIAVIVGVLLLGSTAKRARVVMSVGAVAAAVVFIAAPDTIGGLVLDKVPTSLGTFTGRTEIWGAAMQGFYYSPIFGYGPTLLDESFRWAYLPSFDAAAQAHNQFVQTLAGQGIVGIGSLAVLLLAMLRYGVKTRDRYSSLGLALVASFTLTCVTETPLRPAGPTMYSLFFAVLIAFLSKSYVEKRDAEQAQARSLRTHPAGVSLGDGRLGPANR